MATRCFPSGITRARGYTTKAKTRVARVYNCHTQPNGVSTLPSKFYMISSKVFEDQALGIICYRDQKGEVVCEGYDEGPRFSRQTPQKIHSLHRHRELQTLQQRWLQISEDVESHRVKGVGIHDSN